MEEEGEEWMKPFVDKLKTINGAQESAEGMEDEKGRQIVGTAFEKGGKIQNQNQR
jgi:hypothetical protein